MKICQYRGLLQNFKLFHFYYYYIYIYIFMEKNLKKKYLKYKIKYLNLKGGIKTPLSEYSDVSQNSEVKVRYKKIRNVTPISDNDESSILKPRHSEVFRKVNPLNHKDMPENKIQLLSSITYGPPLLMKELRPQIKYDNIDFFLNFNNKRDEILKIFENFTNIDLIINNIKRINKDSGTNGNINKIIFTKMVKEYNHKINLLLKTPKEFLSDNNYYEFVIGLCINKFKIYFPNFCYTFGYGKITEKLKEDIEKDDFVDIIPDSFKKNYFIQEINENNVMKYSKIGEGCILNGYTSLLIEEIPNSKTLWDYYNDIEFMNPLNVNYNIFCILYQVYFVLNQLKDNFTHYDLHPSNILISKYEKPIIIKYKFLDGKEKQLYTKYIPVFIDYGRSFVNCLENDSLINSTNYLNTACYNTNCRMDITNYSNCKLLSGLFMNKNNIDSYDNNENFHYITPFKKNNTTDLLLIHKLFERFNIPGLNLKEFYDNYFNPVKCNEWFKLDMITNQIKLAWGAPEQKSELGKLKRIEDLLILLDYYYEIRNYENKKKVPNELCLGEITIYENMVRPWSFIEF